MNKEPEKKIGIHWNVNKKEREWMARLMFERGIEQLKDVEREFWFPDGWELELLELRKRQRKQGVKDELFKRWL